MTPFLNLPRSISGTWLYGIVRFDKECAITWSLDYFTKRAIIIGAIVIALSGAVPLLSVHGQPKTDLDWKVQHLDEEVKDLRNVPTEIALIEAHLRLQDEWHKDDQNLKAKMVDGFLAVIGAFCLALFGWLLGQLGITIGKKERVS